MASHLLKNMLLTFQDRLRISWRGGAKQITLDIWLSAFAMAFIFAVAAINIFTAVIIILTSVFVINYTHYYVKRFQIKTRVFACCLLWSTIYMIILIEFAAPLLEFLPEEHLILIILAGVSVYCFWVTHRRTRLNFILQASKNESDLPNIDAMTIDEQHAAEKTTDTTLIMENSDLSITTNISVSICNFCRKYRVTGTVHCELCGVCILQQSHHSYWLNCCIGYWNNYYYLSALGFGILALMFYANLILTAVCHPFIVIRLFSIAIMLPDDCSEVFSEYVLSLSFIVAIYAIIMTFYMLVALCKQIFYISRMSNKHPEGPQQNVFSMSKLKDIFI